MPSKVRFIAALACVLALGSGAAGALPRPANHPQAHATPTAGQVGASVGLIASGRDGKLYSHRGNAGSQLDPDGLLARILGLIFPPPPPSGGATSNP